MCWCVERRRLQVSVRCSELWTGQGIEHDKCTFTDTHKSYVISLIHMHMHMQVIRQSYYVYMWSARSKHNKTISWLWEV